jgi:hypothetical protein
MEPWKRVWREGFAPGMSRESLVALREGLANDDPGLLQGATTSPPPLMAVQNWPCEGACLVGYAGWRGEGLDTVGGVEEYFARACFEADQRLGETAGCRWLLNFFDDCPRGEVRRELLAEVERELERRDEQLRDPADIEADYLVLPDADPLAPARGIALGLLASVPFWVGLFLLIL